MVQQITIDLDAGFASQARQFNLARMAGVSGIIGPLNGPITVETELGGNVSAFHGSFELNGDQSGAHLHLVDLVDMPQDYDVIRFRRGLDDQLIGQNSEVGSLTDDVLQVDF